MIRVRRAAGSGPAPTVPSGQSVQTFGGQSIYGFGSAVNDSVTPTGQSYGAFPSIWPLVTGAGPWFGSALPDGNFVFGQMTLTDNEVKSTCFGTSIYIWNTTTFQLQNIPIPTTTGEFFPPGVDGATGATIDQVIPVTISGVNYIFAVSAFGYAGWQLSAYGEPYWLMAFKETAGVWAFDSTHSKTAAQLAASSAAGASAFPNTVTVASVSMNNSTTITVTSGGWPGVAVGSTVTDSGGHVQNGTTVHSISGNTIVLTQATTGGSATETLTFTVINAFGENIHQSLGPTCGGLASHSQHLIIGNYFYATGHHSGSILAINPATGVVTTFYQFPDITDTSSVPCNFSVRDLTLNPTSGSGDERFVVTFDVFIRASGTNYGLHPLMEFSYNGSSTITQKSPALSPYVMPNIGYPNDFDIVGYDGSGNLWCPTHGGVGLGIFHSQELHIFLASGANIPTFEGSGASTVFPTLIKGDFRFGGFTLPQGTSASMNWDSTHGVMALTTLGGVVVGAHLAASPALGSEMAVNGGLTSGTTGWNGFFTSTLTTTADSDFTSGECLVLTSTAGIANNVAQAAVPVVPFQNYILTAKVKGVTLPESVRAEMWWHDASGDLIFSSNSAIVVMTSTNVTTIECLAAAPPDATTAFVLFNFTAQSVGEQYKIGDLSWKSEPATMTTAVDTNRVRLISESVSSVFPNKGAIINGRLYFTLLSVDSVYPADVGESIPHWLTSLDLSTLVTPAPPVVTVPSAPTLTSATAGASLVSLIWTAPLASGGSPLTSYTLLRSTTSGAETVLVTGISPLARSYTDSTAVNGTTYYYKLAAVNAVGTSAVSNEQSATPAAALPSSPVLSVTAGNTQNVLTWSAPAIGSPFTGYEIYSGPTSTSLTLQTTVGTITHPQAIVASATANKATQTYTPSNVGDLLILIVNLEGFSAGPAVTTVTDNGITPTSGSGKWTLVKAAPGAATYGRQEMWMATANSTSAGTVTVTYASTPGVTVELVMDSISAGFGAATLWTTVNPASSPNSGTPTTITYPSVTSAAVAPEAYYGFASCTGAGSAGSTSGFTYEVTAEANVAVYNLTCAATAAEQPTAATNSQTYNTVAAIFYPTTASLTFTDTGLTNGTEVFYAVYATNANGMGTASNVVGATPVGTALTAPPAVSGLAAVVSGTTATASWTNNGTTGGGNPTTSDLMYLDGTLVGNPGTVATSWPFTGLSPGSHTLGVAPQNSGGIGTRTNVTVTISGVASGVVVSKPILSGGPPTARGQGYGGYDPVSGQIIYFGGNNGPPFSDTWALNPSTNVWTHITSATAPANVAAGIGYDPISNRMIMFGGDNESTWFNNTFSMDTTLAMSSWAWTQLSPAGSVGAGTLPDLRSGQAMFNDPVTGKLMMYGGNVFRSGANTYWDDLWEWTGTAWTRISAALTGTGRTGPFVATMSNGTTVIFGGFTNSVANDTHVWNGTTCVSKSPAHIPPARGFGGCAATNTGLALIYGGTNRASTVNQSDCWTWNGTDWTQQTPTGVTIGGLSSQSMNWDATTETIISAFGTAGASVNTDINTVYSITVGAAPPPPPPPPPGGPPAGFFTRTDSLSNVTALSSSLGLSPLQGYATYTTGTNYGTIASYSPPTLPSGCLLMLGVNMLQDHGTFSQIAANISTWSTLAGRLPNGTIVRLGWEFDIGTGTGGFGNVMTPANYVTGWQQIHGAMKAVNPTLLFDWCCNSGTSNLTGSNGKPPLSAWYPGDSYVDYIGGDHYDNPGGGGDFSQMLSCVTLANQRSKPVSIGEWGLNGADNPTFINDAVQFILSPTAAASRYGMPSYTVVYHSYFSDTDFNSDITTFPNSFAAYKAGFG